MTYDSHDSWLLMIQTQKKTQINKNNEK